MVSIPYTLQEGNLQAVRVVFRYGGTQKQCPTGAYDDVDDLVFKVASAAPDAAFDPMPEYEPAKLGEAYVEAKLEHEEKEYKR